MRSRYLDRQTGSGAGVSQMPEDLYGPNIYVIANIRVPESRRGTGAGSRLLKQIIRDADQEGSTLVLVPSPSGGLSYKELVDWYRRHGFRLDKGGYMERLPGGTSNILEDSPMDL